MNSDDMAGVAGNIFYLLAQFGDVHVDGARQRETVVAPHRVEQLIAGYDLAAMLDKVSENFELPRREIQKLAGFDHSEIFEIEHHFSELIGLQSLCVPGNAAQH